GRDHQPGRDVAGELDRDRDLGRGRRPRHACGRDPRRGRRQWSEELLHPGVPGILALRARAAVHPGDPVHAARACRYPSQMASSGMKPVEPMIEEAERPAQDDIASRHMHPVTPGEVDLSHGAILYLEDISVSFEGFRALNKLSLMIEVGELRCVIGPNGAGKTTMMDVITGRTRPDAGTVLFRGDVDLTRRDEADIARLGIGRKFQKPTIFEHHTVFENLELAMK